MDSFRVEFRRLAGIAVLLVAGGLLVSMLAGIASGQTYAPVYLYAMRAQDEATFARQAATVASMASTACATQASQARVRCVERGGDPAAGDAEFVWWTRYSAGAAVRLADGHTAYDAATVSINVGNWLDAYTLFTFATSEYLEAKDLYVTAAEYALSAARLYGG